MIYERPENGWETRSPADGSGVKDLGSDALDEYWLGYYDLFSGRFAYNICVGWTSEG